MVPPTFPQTLNSKLIQIQNSAAYTVLTSTSGSIDWLTSRWLIHLNLKWSSLLNLIANLTTCSGHLSLRDFEVQTNLRLPVMTSSLCLYSSPFIFCVFVYTLFNTLFSKILSFSLSNMVRYQVSLHTKRLEVALFDRFCFVFLGSSLSVVYQ